MCMPSKDVDKKRKSSKPGSEEPVIQLKLNEPVMTMVIDGNTMSVDAMQFNNAVAQPLDKAKKIKQDLPAEFIKKQVEDIWSQVEKNKVKLSYAVVGVTSNGRQVYSYDALIDLLTSYGY